jgi:hypothetical protein
MTATAVSHGEDTNEPKETRFVMSVELVQRCIVVEIDAADVEPVEADGASSTEEEKPRTFNYPFRTKPLATSFPNVSALRRTTATTS